MDPTTTPCPDLPDRCELEHQVFSSLGEVHFRLSTTDGLPMMALRLGEREAQFPLESLRREYSIGKDTNDGRMLDLIGSALDFVSSLQPGDKLPSEIRTGEASWKPSTGHLRLVTTRLRLDLCTWLEPGGRWAKVARDDESLRRTASSTTLRDEAEAAAGQAAMTLGISSGGDVIQMIEGVARELAYIEALRERLLSRVADLRRRVGALWRDRGRMGTSFDNLSQVHRLLGIAMRQLFQRFEDVDSQTASIENMLRNMDTQRSFIRSNRDWLYRSQRAWEPILDRWSRTSNTDDTAPLLGETYQFLAPRFMPTTAWRSWTERKRGPAAARMTW
jgi:hypothetical protein